MLGACEGACERPVMRGAVLLLIVAQGAALPSSRPIEKFDSAWLSEFLGTNVESTQALLHKSGKRWRGKGGGGYVLYADATV